MSKIYYTSSEAEYSAKEPGKMHIQEKQAWFTIAIFLFTLVVFLIAAMLIGFRWETLGTVGVFGLVGLGPRILLKGKSDPILMDERDQEILRKATLGGMKVFWVLFVLCGTVAPLLWGGFDRRVTFPIGIFPMIVVLSTMVFFAVQALAVIVLYRRVGDVRTE
jgi:hypothetical protein